MLSVLTFNTASFNDGPLWKCTHYESGQPLWDFRDVQRQHVLDMMLQHRPHVLCLQETILAPPRSKHLVARHDGDESDGDDGVRSRQPPPFSLDAAESGAAAASCTPSQVTQDRKAEQVAELLRHYHFCGRTSTHADETVLYVRKQAQSGPHDPLRVELLPPIPGFTSVDGEGGGDSQYNFPLAVLRLQFGDGARFALVAVTSVHLTPFSSRGGRRKDDPATCETRRDAQLRRTFAGLYTALAKHATNARASSYGILVAGDYNIKPSERCLSAESLGVHDAHDVLRAALLPALMRREDEGADFHTNSALPPELAEGFVLPRERWGFDDVQRQNASAPWRADRWSGALPEMMTWDSTVNRFNGGGAEFVARFDRVLWRTVTPVPPEALEAEARRAAGMVEESSGAGGAALALSDDQTLRPVALVLVGQKPIKDANLDRIDAECFEKRRRFLLLQRAQQQVASPSGQSLIADEEDDAALKPRLDEDLFDDDNEHAGAVPAGGRDRFLSDHYGLLATFIVNLA